MKLTTGLEGLDLALNLPSGECLIYLGVDQGMIQTSFIQQLALASAKRKMSVAYFSFQVRYAELLLNLLNLESSLGKAGPKLNNVSPTELASLSSAVQGLAHLKFFINDNTDITLEEIQQNCQNLQKQSSLNLIVIDQPLPLIYDHESQLLKKISKQFNVPVVVNFRVSEATARLHEIPDVLMIQRESASNKCQLSILKNSYSSPQILEFGREWQRVFEL